MWTWIRSWGNFNDRQIKQKSKIKTQQFVTQVWIWDENGKLFFYEKGLSRCYKIFKPQSAHTRADLLISYNRHCRRKGLPQVHGASKVLCPTCFTFQTSNVLLHTPIPNIPRHFPWTQETNVLDSFTMIDLRFDSINDGTQWLAKHYLVWQICKCTRRYYQPMTATGWCMKTSGRLQKKNLAIIWNFTQLL